MSTKAVTADHVFVARFAANLLQTKRVERSNSVRGRLLNILREAIAVHRSSIREVSFVSECLSSTSPFDSDEANFRACIQDLVSCLGRSPAPVIGEIASTIRRLLTEAGYSDIMEATLKAFKRRDEDEKLVAHINAALLERHVNITRKEIQDFLGSKSGECERSELLVGLIDAVLR
jgi:hypothetical protein